MSSQRRVWSRLLADPLFLIACLVYGLNRWVFLALVPGASTFFRHHFNDVLLIPAALPPLLGLYALLRLRPDWRPPTPGEVAAHLLLWTLLCEWIGPMYLHKGTADWLDALAYAVGASIATIFWQWKTKSADLSKAVSSSPVKHDHPFQKIH